MSRVHLLPRLTRLGVTRLRENFAGTQWDVDGVRQFLGEHAALVTYAASGGAKDENATFRIGERLRQIAQGCGYPDNTSNVAQSKFDHEASIHLSSCEELATGEGLRDDVWAFLTVAVAPDVVAWRFSDKAEARYAGGVRNAFQRLWMRGSTLDRGSAHPQRWALVRGLTEDALVQIFERPSIGGNRSLAIALAEGWLRTAERIGRKPMEPIMRAATKILRLRNEIIDLGLLDPDELSREVDDAFRVGQADVEASVH